MANIQVTTFDDQNNGNPGGRSLREAIAQASAGDTITFSNSGTINLTLGELVIDEDLTINGDLDGDGRPDITINAGNSFRVFNINDGNSSSEKDIVLNGLVVTGGQSTGSGGGIFNRENLTLINSQVSNNNTTGNFNQGGGIYNRGGSLTISNTTISGNSTNGRDGRGGGIFSLRADLTINNSTISGNNTLGDNSGGGGVYSYTDLTTFTTIVTNSTLSGNTVANGPGGGLLNRNGRTIINNSTITNNSASNYGSGVVSAANDSTRTEVSFSIISGNSNNTDVRLDDTGAFNSFVSNGYNLIGNSPFSGDAANFNATGDTVGNNAPGLAGLADNGGPTQTHALLSGSAAIDAANINSLLPDTTDVDNDGNTSELIPIDQRGLSRVFNNSVDIGAFELQPPIVSLTAIDASAAETGDTATYRLSRNFVDGALSVQLRLGLGTGLTADDFSLSGGSVSINGTTATVTIPNGSSFVDITLTATDDNQPEDDETLTLSLLNRATYVVDGANSSADATIIANDPAPEITSSATATVDENQIIAIDVNATDENGDTEGNGLTYAITGGAEADLFSIDESMGVVTFDMAPDFENPDDIGSDNQYSLEVTVTNSTGATDTQSITITVNDVTEAATTFVVTTLADEDFGGGSLADELADGDGLS